MSNSKLKQIDQLLTPENPDFHQACTELGDVWASQHDLVSDTSYRTSMPAGLHLGGGYAPLSTQSPTLGCTELSGASFNVLFTPNGFEEKFTTKIGKGRGFSGGAYFDLKSSQRILEELLDILPERQPFMASHKIPYRIVQRLCAPIDPWFQGESRRLAEEARAYEFIAVATAFLKQNSDSPAPRVVAKRYAQQARDIIDADIMSSPSLTELAKMAATNVRSLTQAFKDAYGCTVQSYISERRMQRSLELLEQGMSVTEVAYQVGYSLGHFSDKFRRHFNFTAQSVVIALKIPNN